MKKIVMYFFMAILLVTLSGCGSEEYLVDFLVENGESVDQEIIVEGDLIIEPSDQVLEGHSFDGWYTDSSYTTAFDYNTVITEDTTLYAQIIINEYTIHYYYIDDNDEFILHDAEFDYNTTIEVFIFEIEGYTFEGWYTTNSFDEEYVFGAMPASDISVYGKWVVDETYSGTYKIVMITDSGPINDAFFNQAIWEGVESYALQNLLTYTYYQPLEMSTSAYLDAISLAVEHGAEVIVLPGFPFEGAVIYAQQLYTDIQFILLDGTPHNDEHTIFETADNTARILFNEHEAGFLAGYAAVMDGYRNVAFTGGYAISPVFKYGVGYIAGAYYAAEELGVEITFDNDNFIYFNAFWATAEAQSIAAGLYQNGVEVIFAVAGGAGASVMYAASFEDALMIGVDIDQSTQSDVILTSAMKTFSIATYQALEEYFNGTLVTGDYVTKGAADGVVSLPMDTSRFTTFTQAQYEAIYELISNGTIVVPAFPEDLELFFNTYITGTKDYPDSDTINNIN